MANNISLANLSKLQALTISISSDLGGEPPVPPTPPPPVHTEQYFMFRVNKSNVVSRSMIGQGVMLQISELNLVEGGNYITQEFIKCNTYTDDRTANTFADAFDGNINTKYVCGNNLIDTNYHYVIFKTDANVNPDQIILTSGDDNTGVWGPRWLTAFELYKRYDDEYTDADNLDGWELVSEVINIPTRVSNFTPYTFDLN